jgi:hypothetical protein
MIFWAFVASSQSLGSSAKLSSSLRRRRALSQSKIPPQPRKRLSGFFAELLDFGAHGYSSNADGVITADF